MPNIYKDTATLIYNICGEEQACVLGIFVDDPAEDRGLLPGRNDPPHGMSVLYVQDSYSLLENRGTDIGSTSVILKHRLTSELKNKFWIKILEISEISDLSDIYCLDLSRLRQIEDNRSDPIEPLQDFLKTLTSLSQEDPILVYSNSMHSYIHLKADPPWLPTDYRICQLYYYIKHGVYTLDYKIMSQDKPISKKNDAMAQWTVQSLLDSLKQKELEIRRVLL